MLRQEGAQRGVDVMGWDVLGGIGPRPMTNVRNLGLPQWRRLAEYLEQRCLVPLTRIAEWTREKHKVGTGKPIKGGMWFDVPAPAGVRRCRVLEAGRRPQRLHDRTCEPNETVAPIHPKAMITILEEADWDRWLSCSYDEVVALPKPYPANKMTVRGPVFPTRAV